MPLVDYRLAGLDPWKKYEENREYLLRKANLDESIASRRSGEERANRQLAVDEQKNALEAVKTVQSIKKEQVDEARKMQETTIAKIGTIGNLLANADEDSWSDVRSISMNLMTRDLDAQLNAGIIDRKQYDDQVNTIENTVPKEYDPNFVNSTIRAMTDAGKKQGIEHFYTRNNETGATKINPYIPGTAITIPPNETPIGKLDSGVKTPTTAMAAFLQQNPNATPDEIALFAQKLKGKGIRVETPDGTIIELGGGQGKQSDETQKAIGKEFGKGVGERANQRTTGGFEAYNQNFQLDLVKEAIQNGARTGFGEETLLNIKSAAQTFGIDTGDLSGQELVRKISNEMALRLRNPESGLGLTGNTSNKDLDFLKASVVGLSRTEAGNMRIIDAMKKLNGIKIQTAKEQQRIIKENGGKIPTDMDTKILEFVDKLSVLTPDERKDIERLSQKIIKTGTKNGRKVVMFEDGTVEYAD